MKKKNKLRLAGFCTCAAVFALSGGMLLHNRHTADREQEAFRQLAEQVQSIQQQNAESGGAQAEAPYAALAGQNSDLCGWISIENTVVDYPVMHTPDAPEHYLRRDFEGRYSVAGTPFLDARCDMELGPLLIVYGHNMNDGSMFASVQGYLDEAYRALYPVIRCDSLTQTREYEVFAVLKCKATQEAAEAYYTIPRDEQAFAEYVQRVRDNAVYCLDTDIRWGDQLLALSTCDARDRSARILVIAKRMG